DRGGPRSPPWRTSQVPAGVLTAELGSADVTALVPEATAAFVALATACIDAERTPASGVLPESSSNNGEAEEEVRIRAPEASSSTTPGASGTSGADSHASATSPRRTTRANR